MNDEPNVSRRRSVDFPPLRVYVAGHCTSCRESRRLAKVISGRLKEIAVEVVDIDRHKPADEIFAVPTFCYRGKILFLGNPREDDLVARVLSLERESIGSRAASAEYHGPNAPFPDAVPKPNVEVAAVSRREDAGRKNVLIAAWTGALGLVGTLLCSLTMVAPALGLIALQGARSSMAGMNNADMVGQAQLPGWWTTVMHLGPYILILSALLVVVAVGVRRPVAMTPAIAGTLVLYLGMYTQPSLTVMETATIIGTGLLVLSYAASLQPSLSLATVRFNR